MISENDKEKRAQFVTEIFTQYGNEIRAMIEFNVKDHTDADDVFQDFFLSLISNPIPTDISNMKRYLFKAITHDIFNMSRRMKRYQERMRNYAEIRRYTVIQDDPQSIVIKAEETQKFFVQVQHFLRPTEAKVLFWRYRKGNNTAETAKRMGIKPRSCARYLCSALKKIKNLELDIEGGT